MSGTHGPDLDALRERAERALLTTRRDVEALSGADRERLLHELQVHQIELEMQNDELRARTQELEEMRSQYQELYEFAPVAYLDLDSSGVIRRANHAASRLFGTERQRLVGRALWEFVDPGDVIALHNHLRGTARDVRSLCEVRLTTPHDRQARVLVATSCDAAPTAGYLMALTDVTDHRRAEEALHAANQKLERVSIREHPAGAEYPRAPAPGEWQGAGRVLVVDDDEQVLRAVARQLAAIGFEVVTTGDGSEALLLLREAKAPFSLVVLDRTMPGLSGDEVLSRLRKDAPALPVLLISGWSTDELILPDENVAFLQKPMTVSELTRGVRKLLEAGRQRSAMDRVRQR